MFICFIYIHIILNILNLVFHSYHWWLLSAEFTIYSCYTSVITKIGNILDKNCFYFQGSRLRPRIEFKVILRTIFHADFYRHFLICHSKTSHKVATSVIPSFKQQESRHKRDSVICPVSDSERQQMSFQMQTILFDS